MRYHRARLEHTCVSLRSFLEAYKSNEHDEGLEDPVTYMTQDEFFLDTQSKVDTICCPKNLPYVRTIMRECPVVCRTLTVSRISVPGITMNPWLSHVVAMPNVVRYLNTSDFLRFQNKVHGSELINCAMLVTKNPGGSILAAGVGKHIQSYLLCGDDGIFHNDADLATWAMVVTHVLTQPDQQSWMMEELERIDFMHGAVYSEEGSSWRKYLATVRSSDFRMALVTQSKHLEPWLQCPHLNKFLLACFLLRRELSPEEMEARRNAAVQEFFGRQCKPKLLSYMFETKWETQLNDIFEALPFQLKPTLRETIHALMGQVHKHEWSGVKFKVIKPNQETCRLTHLNLSCATMVCLFKRLNPAIGELDDETWYRLFTTGMSVPDSYKRNNDLLYKFDEAKLVRDIRAKLRRDAIELVPRYTQIKYQEAMLEAHRDPPVLITKEHCERFKEKHGRDLGAELDVNDFGLSLTACMCPRCPFFRKPLGARNAQRTTPCPQLHEHTHTFAPKVNNVAYIHVLFAQMEVKDLAFVNVLNKIYNDGGGMDFQKFESYFVQ